MPPLLDLLQSGQLHWLTARGHVHISLPPLLASGSGMAGYGQVALLLLGAAVPGCARLVWLKLLPHEKVRLNRCKDYLVQAQHALDQAASHLEGTKNHRPHIAQMIGIAYFSLRLRQDTAAAARWMSLIAAHRLSLDHYATWLREHYAYVCAVLESRSQSQQAAQL